jgi:hypothetical protein
MGTKQDSCLSCWAVCILAFFLAHAEAANAASPIKNLTVIAPNGGETFSLNDSITIRWDMGDSVNAMMGQLVFTISLDSGKTFLYLGDIRKSSPFWQAKSIKFSLRDSIWDEQSIQWKAIVPSNGCMIHINEYNITSIYDESDSFFRITASAFSNYFTHAIRKTRRSVWNDIAYDVQGRRIRISSSQLQKIPAKTKESKSVYFEHGQINLIAR